MMQLYYSATSPFARKCRIALSVLNLNDAAQQILADPFSDSYRELNPLGKIPLLITDSLTLADSVLICEYLDHKSLAPNEEKLFRKHSADYFKIQCAHYQANGILDAAVATIMEARRTTEHSSYWLERWKSAIEKSISSFDESSIGNSENINIATIALASALAYLDFRLVQLDWRSKNKNLADWFEKINGAHWMVETRPS